MAEQNIKAGWLEDYSGEKFAPKTVASQILDIDGTSYKDKIDTSITGLKDGTIAAGAAAKLAIVNTGDINTPVYFEDGIPKPCTTTNTSTGILSAEKGGTGNVTGRVQIGQSNDTEIGKNATSEGKYTKAVGDYSHAEGDGTKATGNYSHAEGSNTLNISYDNNLSAPQIYKAWEFWGREFADAHGSYSHAEGNDNLALETASHAEGSQNIAMGISSHVEGAHNDAIKAYSHAEGYFTKADGIAAHTEGQGGHAIGQGAHIEGVATIFVAGTITGDANTVDYILTVANDEINTLSDLQGAYICYCQADEVSAKNPQWNRTRIISMVQTSTAEDSQVFNIITENSLAETALANEYVIIINHIANGKGAHAEGLGNYAIGMGTHAGGENSCANHNLAFVHGYKLTTNTDGQTFFGQYNNPNGTMLNSIIFGIGNGNDATLQNIFEVNANGDGYFAGGVQGAVWNDYAEYRDQEVSIEPGYCVASSNNGKIRKTTEKFQACDGIVSDTFGFSIGKTENNKTPLAVAGRVLAYYSGNREDYQAGDTVCAGPEGKIYKMTRDEVKEWPDRIVGIVSEIPEYKTWGSGNILVNNRIWIKVV